MTVRLLLTILKKIVDKSPEKNEIFVKLAIDGEKSDKIVPPNRLF